MWMLASRWRWPPWSASASPSPKSRARAHPDVLAYGLGVAGAAVLLARRRRPVAVLGATLMVSLAYHLIGYPAGPTNLPILVAVYTAAAAGRLTLALLAGGAFTGVGVAYRSLVEGDPLGVEDGLADSIPAELLQAAPVTVVRVAVHQMDCVVLAGLDS